MSFRGAESHEEAFEGRLPHQTLRLGFHFQTRQRTLRDELLTYCLEQNRLCEVHNRDLSSGSEPTQRFCSSLIL